MMKIKVYGPGCARCKQTEEIVRRALSETGTQAEVEKVSDIQALAQAGILATPAVAVDGVLKAAGRIPRLEEVKAWVDRKL
jgi:small redox-active disulfide protein 2